MTKKIETESIILPNILAVGIDSPLNKSVDIDSYYQEFLNLLKSNDITYQEAVFIKIRSIDPAYFITKGKLDELIKICQEKNIDQVVFSETIAFQQERNLSRILKAKVFDRTQLILDIFEKGAHSAEGKTQVAIAMLQHKKTRLAGKGHGMAQQMGAIGGRGPGETAKEKEMQHIERLILKLKRDLDKLEKHRNTQRKKRLNANIKQVCLIGYTNAGKSTILNALTQSNVLAEDRLFATLDTTTRELYIDGAQFGVISDTVGFIQQLPHKLIEAFKSTLSELEYATLLLHVIDISDKNWQHHIAVVLEILKEMNIDKPMLYVFNKADSANIEIIKNKIEKYQPNVIVSAKTEHGLEPLIEFLRNFKV